MAEGTAGACGQLKHLCDLAGHKERGGQVWCIAWSPSGKLLASCGGDKDVRIWAKDTHGKWQCNAILEDAHDRTVRAVAWSPGEDRIATASFDGTCVVWSKKDGEYEQVATLQGHENEVKSVAFDPSGKLLATCSRDKSVWVWEAMQDEDDYECVGVLHGHNQDVKMVAWHPTKEVLVSASYDDTLRVWIADEDDWESAQTLDTHSSTVWSLAFDGTGARMASVGDDLTLRIWKDTAASSTVTASYEEEAVVRNCHTRPIYSVDWHPSKSLIATAAGDDAVRIFGGGGGGAEGKDWSQGVVVQEKAHRGDVNCVRWMPQGAEEAVAVLASAGDDNVIRLWSFGAAA